MPLPIIGGIAAALGAGGVALAARVLIGLGLSTVTYVGISSVWDSLKDQIWSNFGSAGGSILTILGMARVDDGIKVIMSVSGTILLLKGLGAAGAFKALRWKPPV